MLPEKVAIFGPALAGDLEEEFDKWMEERLANVEVIDRQFQIGGPMLFQVSDGASANRMVCYIAVFYRERPLEVALVEEGAEVQIIE